MPIKNCPVCNKIFDDHGMYEVCPACYEENERDFKRVREFLYQYPNTNIIEVAEVTGVSIEKLKRFLRNDRLIAINNNCSSLLGCQKCGKPISAGIYCTECQREVDVEKRKASSAYMGGSYRNVKMHTKYTDKK